MRKLTQYQYCYNDIKQSGKPFCMMIELVRQSQIVQSAIDSFDTVVP